MIRFRGLLRRCLPVQAHELERGMLIKLQEGQYAEILGYRHLKTGQGHTESIVEYLDLTTFKLGKLHVNTNHKFDKVDPDYVPAVTQFMEGNKMVVSESSTFEQIEVPLKFFQGAEKLFPPGTQVTLIQDEDEVIKVAVSPDKLHEIKKLKPQEQHSKRREWRFCVRPVANKNISCVYAHSLFGVVEIGSLSSRLGSLDKLFGGRRRSRPIRRRLPHSRADSAYIRTSATHHACRP